VALRFSLSIFHQKHLFTQSVKTSHNLGMTITSAALTIVIIKFPYNTCSDWLKQRALSEKKAGVDDGKLALENLLRNFGKFILILNLFLKLISNPST